MIEQLKQYLETSYTAYQAVEAAQDMLLKKGFRKLSEGEPWNLSEGGKYFVVRGGSALIAFTLGKGNGYKIVASHTDSPCLKLKENPVTETAGYRKLNAETYGGGLYYTFFDRPLKLAGRIVRSCGDRLVAENYVSDFTVVIPSLAIHMNREANDKFAPNPQVDLLPLLSLKDEAFSSLIGEHLSFDLYAVCAEKPFVSGANGEFLSSPRIDNLSSVLSSLTALSQSAGAGVCVAACLDNEEVGSRTLQGAGSDFLVHTLKRIALCRGLTEEAYYNALATSFLVSLDNAHALHPNHPEKCDPTNRPVMGGGVVIKGHADKAYTTDALTSAVMKKIFSNADVAYQTFFNRSDMRSGGTLGAISLGKVSIPSVDIGLAQLAMHSAVETVAADDYVNLVKGLTAFYESDILIAENTVTIG